MPILMLTARDSELDKVVGLELGADDYVTKPFSLRELQARIRAILRRTESGPPRSAEPAHGRPRSHPGRHRRPSPAPRRAEVALKPKAFELLAFLLQHPGQVFTREQLLDHVWGYAYAGETRTVDVHIHWLRPQIEEDRPTHSTSRRCAVSATSFVARRPEAPVRAGTATIVAASATPDLSAETGRRPRLRPWVQSRSFSSPR